MRNTQKGQSLIELLFAIVISAIILTGIVSVSLLSVRNSSSSRDRELATQYGQHALEYLRFQKNSLEWNNSGAGFYDLMVGGSGTQYCFNTLVYPPSVLTCADFIGGIFQRTITLTTGGVDEINAQVIVTWTDSQGAHDVTLNTTFADWEGAL